MYLDGENKYAIDFSFTQDKIIFNNNSDINPETKEKEIIIPFDTDLTYLESRLIALESNEEGLTIEKINDINPYLGIDEYYALIDIYEIQYRKDEKFFHFYRSMY
jgi:hypothetical protein